MFYRNLILSLIVFILSSSMEVGSYVYQDAIKENIETKTVLIHFGPGNYHVLGHSGYEKVDSPITFLPPFPSYEQNNCVITENKNLFYSTIHFKVKAVDDFYCWIRFSNQRIPWTLYIDKVK